MSSSKVTAGDIRALLHTRFDDTRRYAYAEEVGNSTGAEQRRRLDMVIVDCWKSNGFAIEGIEIKISKSDLRRELQDASKHNVFYQNLDYYSLAAPASVVDLDLVPKQWGLYLVDVAKDGSLSMRCVRKPCSLHDEFIKDVDKGFIAALLRAMWNSRPSDSMLQAAEKEGYERAMKEAGVTDYKARIKSLEDDNRALRELSERMHIWGGSWGIDRAIQEYEAFRELRIDQLVRVLERIVDGDKHVRKALKLLKERDGEKL